ncbi:MAG: Crp/Fnr family transcriptional regulator [Bacillota bacterium]|jgi:CRP-like cAMP-binding protein
MDKYLTILQNSLFFQDVNLTEMKKILNNTSHKIITYPSEAIIAGEGENCDHLGIILMGRIEIQKIYSSGKTVTIAQFREGNFFGEAIIFSNQHFYPGTVVSRGETKILFLHKTAVITLCRDYPSILESFMRLLSERILMLNKKITELSLGTIRQKICFFLLEEYQKQKSLLIKLTMSKETLAEHMGIQRPSLSRELIKMREEGLIDLGKKYITIKDITQLEEALQE